LALLLIRRLPLAPLQSAIDPDTTALAHVLAHAVGRPAINAHIEEVRPLVEVAVGIATTGVAGDPKGAYAHAGRQRTQLGVSRETAHQNDTVDAE
jgi:hypothetical protein